MDEIAFVDFETDAIEDRPDYPPIPKGVAIWEPGEQPYYVAWGHPEGNGIWRLVRKGQLKLQRTSKPLVEYAGLKLMELRQKYVLGFHHAKFDLDVMETAFHIPIPYPENFEDTLFALFLDDPYSQSLSLKPASERILKMPPEEQEDLRQWLIEYEPKLVKKNSKDWGAHICKAPGNIVAPYAIGDVLRTGKLWAVMRKRLKADAPPEGKKSLWDAYTREKRLLKVLLKNEREGLRVDQSKLEQDIVKYEAAREKCVAWLRKTLKNKDLNIDSDQDLAETLDKAEVVKHWHLTATGQKSVAKDKLLPEHFKDKNVARALGYHSRLGTALGTFMRPWAAMAAKNNGYIATTWNQVRQYGGHGNVGARSGRLSCSPNFMNLPKEWGDKGDGYEHPKYPDVDPLPLCRKYILPDKGEVFGHRDYNQQELRILGHFESDKLCEAYNTPIEQLPPALVKDGRLDVHSYLKDQIKAISGLDLPRPTVKIVVFRTLYGGGASGLAAKLKIMVGQAKQITDALRDAIPGLRSLERDLDQRAASQKPIRTWGGRLYHCEPPSFSEKYQRQMTYEYKLLNYLIQGSAADCTKEAVIAYDELKKEGRFLVTVHDELNISAPKGAIKRELERLREAMESVKFDVPMLSDAKIGPCWGEIKGVK